MPSDPELEAKITEVDNMSETNIDDKLQAMLVRKGPCWEGRGHVGKGGAMLGRKGPCWEGRGHVGKEGAMLGRKGPCW